MAGQLSALAAGYIGRLPYVFGGIPAEGRVDCSSFVNMIVGWKAGLAIPGFAAGQYKGQSHGPVVVSWATSGLCVTVPRAQVQPGDLVIWPGIGAAGHIGFASGGGQFISALDSTDGVKRIPIADVHKPVPVMFRRVKASSAILTSAPGSGAGGCVPSMIMAPFIIATSLATGRRYPRRGEPPP